MSFVLLPMSVTNALQFGTQISLIQLKDPDNIQRGPTISFAILILAAICLLIGLRTKLFHKLNRLFACIKVIALLGLFIEGLRRIWVLRKRETLDISFGPFLTPNFEINSPVHRYFLAFLHILYAYSGWENIPFV